MSENVSLKTNLVDVCVVVGVNEDTDLELLPESSSAGSNWMNNDGGWRFGPYKQFVVGVLTDTLAFFPHSSSKIKGELKNELQVIFVVPSVSC